MDVLVFTQHRPSLHSFKIPDDLATIALVYRDFPRSSVTDSPENDRPDSFSDDSPASASLDVHSGQTRRSRASGSGPRKQVAALPICLDDEGRLRVLLMTSRDTHRLIIPKGWTEKGMKDRQVAAKEAEDEAGVKGRIGRKAIGTFFYWKHLPNRCDHVKVKVFLLEAERQLTHWREEGERHTGWFLLDDAIAMVGDPGIATILQSVSAKNPRRARQLRSPEPRRTLARRVDPMEGVAQS